MFENMRQYLPHAPSKYMFNASKNFLQILTSRTGLKNLEN